MARNNETITLSINVSGNGNLAIRQMNQSLGDTSGAASDASSSVSNIGQSASQSQRQVSQLNDTFSSLSSRIAGLGLAGLAIGLASEIYEVNNEWERLNAIMLSTSDNTEKVKKDFETIRNFKGISFFDKDDIKESYNLLRSQNIEFSEDLLNTITGTAIATNQNIVTVTEQFRAVLNGEEGTLDDYFKAVTKTTDGILVQYTNSEGKLKTKLLQTAQDTAEAMKDQFGKVNAALETTFEHQARIFKEKFTNRIIGDLSDIGEAYNKYYDLIIEKNKQLELQESGIKTGKVNKFLFDDKDVIAGQKIIESNKLLKESNEELADSIKTVNALSNQYQETISDTSGIEQLNNATVKYYEDLKSKGIKLSEEVLKKQSEIFIKQSEIIEENDNLILEGKVSAINRQIEILQTGENKKLLILEDSRNKELEGIINPELINAINNKYDIELELLKNSIEKKKQLTEQQTLSSIEGRISGLGGGFADLTQGQTEQEKNALKLEEINTFYDEKNNLLEEKLNLEILTKEQFAETEVELEKNKSERIIAIRQQTEQSKLQELGDIKSGLDGIGSIFSSFDKIVGKQSKESFEAQKAFGIASATINAYMGASKALATGGPYLGPILAGVQLASGLAQVAQISSQTYQPKFHDGGVVTNGGSLSNEVDATLQTGEGVLSRRGMSALDKLNRGESGSSGSVEVIVVQNMEEALEKQLNSRAGRSMIKEISNG